VNEVIAVEGRRTLMRVTIVASGEQAYLLTRTQSERLIRRALECSFAE
jgi:hypothetical protein